MIIPAQVLRAMRPVEPFCERTVINGMSYGVSVAGYDVRIAENVSLHAKKRFSLASTLEKFSMPNDVLGVVHDKSTLARNGLAVQNTVIEPGWRGFLTLELTFQRDFGFIHLHAGEPIAQIIFHRLEAPTDTPYAGKYQDQDAGAQEARYE